MIVNSDITVFNKRYDRAERTERFYGTQIRGVSFYSRKGTSSGSKELSKSDAYTIRIPADADTSGKKYADQKAYSELDDTVFSGYWTLQPGAIIVQGLVDLETATETELRQSYPEVIFVRNLTDNRSRGSSSMKHWRVGGE